MFKFIKSMTWFVKKNWYRYLFVLFFGLLYIAFNLMPATIISELTAGIENGIVTKDFLIYDILIPFVLISNLISSHFDNFYSFDHDL